MHTKRQGVMMKRVSRIVGGWGGKIETAGIILCSLIDGILSQLLHFLKNKKSAEAFRQREILLIFSGVIGDAVCFLDSVQHYTAVFPEEKGYKITLILKPLVLKFYRECGVALSGIDIYEVDLHEFCMDFRYYRKVRKQLRLIEYNKVIAPQRSISEALCMIAANGREKYMVDDGMWHRGKLLRRMIYALSKTVSIMVPETEACIYSMNSVVNYFSGEHIPSKMPQLPQARGKGTSPVEGKYIVISPYASTYEKNWPIDRWIEIAKRLAGEGWTVVFSDDKEHPELDHILDVSGGVMNLCGMTSLKEWVGLIAKASALLGADSGAVHIAAAVNTPCVSISAGMDANPVYPYTPEILQEDQYVPRWVISKPKPCFGCRRKWDGYGRGNRQCIHAVQKGNPMLCVEEIGVSEVWEEIKKLKEMKRI